MKNRIRWMMLVLVASAYLLLPALSAAAPVDLARTGQTTCYDSAGTVIPCSGTGQDGETQTGIAWPVPRFTDNGNGTITDNLTGLVWLKKADCFGNTTWSQALSNANGLANGSCGLADGSNAGDWRLPNAVELGSLLHTGESDTAAWLISQGFDNVVQPGWYWSSTTVVSNPIGAFSIYFNASAGDAFNEGLKAPYSIARAWPVRGVSSGPEKLWKTGQQNCFADNGSIIPCSGTGQDGELQEGVSWPTPRFTDNGDGTVTDNLTGLVWLKNADCYSTVSSWGTALTLVNGLGNGTCGLSDNSAAGDWRLPNVKEFFSLGDFSQSAVTPPAGHPFINLAPRYWTSNTVTSDPSKAWANVGYAYPALKLNPLYVTPYVWPVRAGTAGLPDTTPPTVVSTNPVDSATDVPINVSVTATFSEAMDATTISGSTFTLSDGGSVSGAVAYDAGSQTATFTPSSDLAYNTTYTATIATGAQDSAGNGLASDHVWTFTTGAAPDTTPPTVVSTNPVDSATDVPVNVSVTATFSEAMDAATITSSTFTLSDGGGPVSGTVTYDAGSHTATLVPGAALSNSTTYTATVTTGVTDIASNAMASDKVWNFTTVAAGLDSDGDGVPDNLDDSPADASIATPPAVTGTGKIRVDTSANAGTTLSHCQTISASDPGLNQTGKPANQQFPDGLVSFWVEGVTPGATVDVTITFPTVFPAGAKYYKVDSAGFHEFPGAVINGNQVILTLTDGGSGDSDSAADGTIIDPGGVGIPVVSSSGNGGWGCQVGRSGDATESIGGFVLWAFPLLWLFGIRRRNRRTR